MYKRCVTRRRLLIVGIFLVRVLALHSDAADVALIAAQFEYCTLVLATTDGFDRSEDVFIRLGHNILQIHHSFLHCFAIGPGLMATKRGRID